MVRGGRFWRRGRAGRRLRAGFRLCRSQIPIGLAPLIRLARTRSGQGSFWRDGRLAVKEPDRGEGIFDTEERRKSTDERRWEGEGRGFVWQFDGGNGSGRWERVGWARGDGGKDGETWFR